jgi:hypothetical protein
MSLHHKPSLIIERTAAVSIQISILYSLEEKSVLQISTALADWLMHSHGHTETLFC